MLDYKFDQVEVLIQRLRPLSGSANTWMLRYLRAQSLFVYLGYAIAQIGEQERCILPLLDPQFASKHHVEYSDTLNRMYSSALAAHAFIRTCLGITKKLIDDAPGDVELERFRNKNLEWVKEISGIRDRIVSHPGQAEDQIVWKPSNWNSNGEVCFNIINPAAPIPGKRMRVTPRITMKQMREYLDGLAPHLLRCWSI